MFPFFFSNLYFFQAKDRQKKKQPTKGIWIDAEGDAYLEDLTDAGAQPAQVNAGQEPSPDPEKATPSNKKVL